MTWHNLHMHGFRPRVFLSSLPKPAPQSIPHSLPPSTHVRTSSCVTYFSNSSRIKFPTMEKVMRPRITRQVTQERWD